MTNAEKIRQMTDEEMAKYFCSSYCPSGPGLCEICFDEKTGTTNSNPKKCKRCWMKWLREEAE